MPRNNEVPSYESLLEFQEVYLRAVALSWENDEFKQAFLEKPQDALARYFGYRCPWTVELRVKEADKSTYGWDQKQGKWYLPRIKMSFGIPKAPEMKERLVAFGAYNDAGPTYLFTCC